MNQREVYTTIEVDGRTFTIRKYDAFTGTKMTKIFASKVLPMFQSFLPMISNFVKGMQGLSEEKEDFPDAPGIAEDAAEGDDLGDIYMDEAAAEDEDDSMFSDMMQDVVTNLDKYLKLDSISKALDMVSEEDLDYIMKRSLMCCHEQLRSGNTAVLLPNGKFGVPDVEYDMLLVMRLVCETVRWGLSDFFTADRWRSIFAPLLNSLPQSQKT